MAGLERGTKRQCLNCGTKFYDLNRDPIACPSCGKIFQLSTPRAEAPRKQKVEEKTVEVVEVDTAAAEAGAEVISLNDAEDDDDDDDQEEVIPDVEDVEVEEELGNDDEDVFLEEDDDEEDNISFGVKDDDDT